MSSTRRRRRHRASSTSSCWPCSTRYCLPPVLITAYMAREIPARSCRRERWNRLVASTVSRATRRGGTRGPWQVGQVSLNDSTSPSEIRLRVISTRPSSEISNTWVRVLSRASASRKTRMTSSRFCPDLHVDEVDHDDPADVAEPELAGDLLGRLEVVAVDRLLEVRAADVLAGVDVDHGERLGALDDERPARRQPHLAVERLEQLLVTWKRSKSGSPSPPGRRTRPARPARARSPRRSPSPPRTGRGRR